MRSLNFWLKAIKILLCVSIIGFGLTLFNAIYLTATSYEMRAEVLLNKNIIQPENNGVIHINSGTYTFKSSNILDKLIFRHTYENWDLIQSLFTFICCCILLYAINGINSQNPFTLKTARCIKHISLLFIAYGAIDIASAFYMRMRIRHLITGADLRYITFPSDLSYLKSGIFILVFSFIYRIGIAYQEENRLIV